MAKYINTIEYHLQTKLDESGISNLMNSLRQVDNKIKEVFKENPAAFNKTKKTIIDIQQALNRSFDADLGILNITKFNQMLKMNGHTIQSIQQDFAGLGRAGAHAFNDLTYQSLSLNKGIKQTSMALEKFANTMWNTVRWGITARMFQSITGEISQAYQYAKDLDTSLNNIRIVTEKSAEEMEIFAQSANKAALALGAGTKEYSDAALIFYQQGLVDDAANKMAELTIKTSRVTQQTTDVVSEQLTSVMMGYQVATEGMERHMDTMALIAAETAADLEEMATAMSKVASAANAMGVGFDQLNAILATVVSVTRQAPENVGTAFKTIFARLGDLKADGADEFGVTLGQIATQLDQMGITILDQNGNLKEMGQVMEEVAGKWENWSRAQKQAAAIAMAGKRQYNNLIALFENWDMYQEQMMNAANAEGTLAKQNEIYLESVEAHLQKVKTSKERVYDAFFDTDNITAAAKTVQFLLQGVAQLIESLGGGIPIIQGIGLALAFLFQNQISNSINKLIISIKSAKTLAESTQTMVRNVQDMFAGSVVFSQQGEKYINATAGKLVDFAKQAAPYAQIMTQEQTTNYQNLLGHLKEVSQGYDDTQSKLDNLNTQTEEYMNKIKQQKEVLATIPETSKTAYIKQGHAVEGAISDLGRHEKAIEATNKVLNDQRIKLNQVETAIRSYIRSMDSQAIISSLMSVTRGVGQLGFAISSLSNIGSIWSNENLSGAEKFLQTIMALSFGLGSLLTGLKAVKTGYSTLSGLMTISITAETAAIQSNTQALFFNTLAQAAGNSESKIAAIENAKQIMATYIETETLDENTKAIVENSMQIILNTATKKPNTKAKHLNILKTKIETGQIKLSTEASKENMVALLKLEKAQKALLLLKNPYVAGIAAVIAIMAIGIVALKAYENQIIKNNKAMIEKAKTFREENKAIVEQIESFQKLSEEYKKTGEGQGNLIEQGQALADSLNDEQLKVYVLTEQWDKYNQKLKETQEEINTTASILDAAALRAANQNVEIEASGGVLNTIAQIFKVIMPSFAAIAGIFDTLKAEWYEFEYILEKISIQGLDKILIEIFGPEVGAWIANTAENIKEVTEEIANFFDSIYSRKDEIEGYSGRFVLETENKTAGEIETDYQKQKKIYIEEQTNLEAQLIKAIRSGNDAEAAALQERMELIKLDINNLDKQYQAIESMAERAELAKQTFDNQIALIKDDSSKQYTGPNSQAHWQDYVQDNFDYFLVTSEHFKEKVEIEGEAAAFAWLSATLATVQENKDTLNLALMDTFRIEAQDSNFLGAKNLLERAMEMGLGEYLTENETIKIMLAAELDPNLDLIPQIENIINELEKDPKYIIQLQAQADLKIKLPEASNLTDIFKSAAEGVEISEKQLETLPASLQELVENASEFNKELYETAKSAAEASLALANMAKDSTAAKEAENLLIQNRANLELLVYNRSKDVYDAQQAVNEAVATYGENSYQAQAAQLALANAENQSKEAVALHKREVIQLYLSYRFSGDAAAYAANTVIKGSAAAQSAIRNLTNLVNQAKAAFDRLAQAAAAALRAGNAARAAQYEDLGLKAYSRARAAQEKIDAIESATDFSSSYVPPSYSAPASGGGGGGGGSAYEPKYLDYIEKEIDRYYDLNQILGRVETAYNKLKEAQERLVGTALLDNLDAQLRNLAQQVDLQKQKLVLQHQERREIKSQLERMGVAFDVKANITNYASIITKYTNDVNSLIDKYNKATTEAQQEALQLQIDAAQEKLDLLKTSIEQYDKLLYQSIVETEEILRDLQNNMIDRQIQKFEYKIQVSLDAADLKRAYLEFQAILNEIDTEDPLEQMNLALKELKTYMNSFSGGTLSTLKKGLEEVNAEIAKMEAGGFSDIFGDNMAAATAKRKELLEELMSAYAEYAELIKSVKKAQLEWVDSASERLEELQDQFEFINSSLEHQANLIGLLYGEKAYDQMDTYYQAQAENYNAQARALQSELDYWTSLRDSVSETDDPELWKAYNEQVQEAQEGLNEIVASSIENLIAQYENGINKIFDAMNDSLTGGLGLEGVEEDWKRINQLADFYLDTTTAAYNINKLQNSFIDAINSTDSVSAQAALTELMGEQLAYLREKENITQYDIDRAYKLLDIERAKIALQEAQTNKANMTLQRDTQGNYTYVFTADESAVTKAQQDLADAQQALYDLDTDAYKGNLDTMLTAYKEWQEAAKAIALDATLTEEERQAKLADLSQYYSEYITNITEENEVIRQNILAESYAGTDELFNNSIQNMIDKMAGEGGFQQVAEEVYDKIILAVEEYQTFLNLLEKSAGVNFENIEGDIEDTSIATQELTTDTKILTKTLGEEAIAIQGIIDELDRYLTGVQKITDGIVELVEVTMGAEAALSALSGTQTTTSPSTATSPSTTTTPTTTPTTTTTITRTYTVVSGDSLWTIAAKPSIYGDGSKYPKLVDLNKDKYPSLTTNPNLIYPGWMLKYNTGGYTGNWASPEGRLAMLHQKEIVLNEEDTVNLLATITALREVTQSLKSGALSSTRGMTNALQNIYKFNFEQGEPIQQQVHIKADFPGVQSSIEIEKAFNNLVNAANQYAYKTRKY